VTDKIFAYLSTVDIARLRLTSKPIKAWATEYLARKQCFLCVNINDREDTPFTFESAKELSLNLGIPIRELSLEVSSEQLYYDEQMQEFLRDCGADVKKLKLSEYFLESEAQDYFLDHVPNVEELKLCSIDGKPFSGVTLEQAKLMKSLPAFFDKLKVLKFGSIQLVVKDTYFWVPFIISAPRLNYLRYPRVVCEKSQLGVNQTDKYDCFRALYKNQRDRFPGDERNWLKFLDFKNLNDSDYIKHEGMNMLFFLDDIKDKGIQLLNVSSEYFTEITDIGMPVEFGSLVKSLVLSMDAPILPLLAAEGVEQVKIPSLRQALEKDWGSLEMDLDEMFLWPKVKSLQIHVDIPLYMTGWRELNALLYSFFPSFGLTQTEELKISFSAEIAKELAEHLCGTVITSKMLATGCPMLKRLTIIRWNPVNSGFVRLWEELPLLEEIWLENCPSLGNVSFVGKNLESPAFLQLSRKLLLI